MIFEAGILFAIHNSFIEYMQGFHQITLDLSTPSILVR
jgi:hypothetical protein